MDGADDGSRQTANAVRQQGYAYIFALHLKAWIPNINAPYELEGLNSAKKELKSIIKKIICFQLKAAGKWPFGKFM
jgi:hypothetical protein